MTIKDIAQYCGVSVSTVSRVLNNRPDVSEEVRNRIISAMEELHYVPNTSARALGQISSDSIGVIVRGGGNPFYTELIQSVEAGINEAGYSMSIRHIPSSADEVAAGATLATSGRQKGIIFLGGCFDYDRQRMAAINVPYVCCTFTNSFGFLPDNAYSSVSVDDREEAEKAVRYLISNGHRKIAILLDERDDSSIGQLRYMGYCDALKKAQIPLDEDLVCECRAYDMDAAYEHMSKFLDGGADFTAVFVIADSLAVAAMKAIHDHGKRIPEDISVIAIDGLALSKYCIPTLTTLVQPRETIGAEAVRALVNVIEGKEGPVQLRLSCDLRQGGSVTKI